MLTSHMQISLFFNLDEYLKFLAAKYSRKIKIYTNKLIRQLSMAYIVQNFNMHVKTKGILLPLNEEIRHAVNKNI
jgi:hypothetical protein